MEASPASSLSVYDDLAPLPRLLMGAGPANVDPRVLRAMSVQLLGQFDPAFLAYMTEVMALWRGVWRTENRWTFLIDGTARAGIEAVLVSVLRPADVVLIPSFGRFGLLLAEIAERCRAKVELIECPWGEVFEVGEIEAAVKRLRPRLVAMVHGDTSTTMLQPLAHIAEVCRRYDALVYIDATTSLGGNELAFDEWGIDVATAGLQKCLSGPSGVAPITLNDRVATLVNRRRRVERGIRDANDLDGEDSVISSNYFDLAMLMDQWGERHLNHHTEATTTFYGARECARILLKEGLERTQDRHRLASDALCAGIEAMGLSIFGDRRHKMTNVTGVVVPAGVSANDVRQCLLDDFSIEISTSFGSLDGHIWRIGTMGYNARKDTVLTTVAALEAALRRFGYHMPSAGTGVDAALSIFHES